MRPAAVFDLDGTLIAGTSAERLLVPWMVRRGVIGVRQLGRSALRALTLPWAGRTRALRSNKLWLSGVPVDAMLSRMDAFLDDAVAPRWCGPVRARLAELRREGHAVFLLSGAPEFIVRAVGARLGAEGVVGTAMEVVDGCFTGGLAGPHRFAAAKPVALHELADAHGLDLEASWAFADHPSDAAFLECVGHPVAVGSSPELLRVARERGWGVVGCQG
ncbi:MAG: HAD-IB family hydrolase [Gemmatimonadota bacterium]